MVNKGKKASHSNKSTKRAQKKRSNPSTSSQSNFNVRSRLAALNPAAPENLYQPFSMTMSNPTGNSKEVVFKATDFFDINSDSDFPYTQYQFDVINNWLFDTTSGTSLADEARVEVAEFYAMPAYKGGTNIADTGVLATFGVPCTGNAGPQDTVTSPSGYTIGQKSTFLTPTSVLDWVKIGTYRSKAFTDSQLQPILNGNMLVLGTLCILNPDDGTKVTDTKIQCRVDITYSQTLPNLATIRQATPVEDSASTAWTTAFDSTSVSSPALIVPLKLRNSI